MVTGGGTANGGSAGTGGSGKPGCIIIYYRRPKLVQSGWLKDKNGKPVLDRLGRRIILLMEARQLHIVRSVQPMAWLISLLIMLLFSFVIHAVIARAVVRLKPTEDVMTR